MKIRSQKKMIQIRDYAEQFYIDNGRSPSTTEIANEIGFSRGTAYKYLVEMNKRGIISYSKGKINTTLTDSSNVDRSLASVVGSIRCGTPEEERAEIKEYVSLPASIFGYGDFYILRAKGDSMNLAGVDDGDLLVIEKTSEASVDDIVVALDEEECNTLKRLEYDEKKHCYYLQAESSNPKNSDIYPGHISIQGIARHVIKAL